MSVLRKAPGRRCQDDEDHPNITMQELLLPVTLAAGP